MSGCLKLTGVFFALTIVAAVVFQPEDFAGAPSAIRRDAIRQDQRSQATTGSSIAAASTGRRTEGTPAPLAVARAQATQPSFVVARFASARTRYTHGVVNLREGPDTSYPLAGSVAANTRLDVLGESGRWYLLRHGGRDVFVAGWLTHKAPPRSARQQPARNQQPSFTCNCRKTCGQMSSCREAYFQLNNCGCGQRDSNNDGVPCESVCR